MKVLLTGAAGFLGSHISGALISQGYSVLGLDDLSTGSLANLQHLSTNKNFDFVEHDIREPFVTKVDLILNFACPASPVQYQANPVRTIETNFLGIINMLHLAHKTGARLLQASTSEVYGDPTVSPQPESYWGNVNPIGVRSCYDEGKRAAETLCFDYRRQYKVDTRVVRIFNTYGPKMSVGDGRVVSNFIVQALKGEPITIYGDGSQSRSFCYVDDLVSGILSVALADKSLDTPINLGNPDEYSMNELSTKILELTSSSSSLIFKKLPLDDPKQRRPDIGIARLHFGWEPTINLTDGLSKTIKYFENIL